MLGKYILRHKLKNPTYVEDPNHQWFDIVDIFQNGNKNEIHLHGILKDKNSVSTDNIEDNAVTASKTNFEIVGSAIQQPNSNQVKITSGSIAVSDLSENARTTLTTVGVNSVSQDALKDNSVITSKINSLAVTRDKIANGAINWDKLSADIDWSNNLPENTRTQNGLVSAGDNNTSMVWATDDNGNPGWRKVSNQFDTKLFGAFISSETPENELTLNSWDYNHCGIWIET